MIEIETKTQKIVTAIYLISDLFDAEDPLRRDARKLATDLASLSGSLAIQSPSQAKKTITEAQNYIDRLQNVLKVCVSVGFVSDMNFKIISEHLALVRDDLNKKYTLLNQESLVASSFHNKAIHEFVLPDFIVKNTEKKEGGKFPQASFSQPLSVPTKEIPGDFPKGQSTAKQKDKIRQIPKGQRIEKILVVVGEKGEVSVSDVAEAFPELSEKTIQRMLIALVESGKLTKKGEKRWSRYSLSV